MSEYIGAKISLISRSDIRYVGILHEINSENSTVALEQVVSYGTEGRRGDPEKEIKPSDTVYEYIVFRGSDVKDLRIEEPAKPQPPKPQVPDDPAILATTQPPNYNRGAAPQQPPPPMPQGQFPGPGQQPGQQFYGQPPMPRPGPGQFSGYMGPYQQPFYGGYMGPQAPVAQNPYIQQQGVMQQPPPVGARGPQAGPIGQAPPPQQPQQQGQAQPSQDNNQSSKQTNGPPGPVGKPPNAQPTPPIPSGSKTTTPAPQQQQARVDSPAQNKAAKDAEKSTGAAPGPSKPIRQSQGPPPYPLTSGAVKTSVPSGPKSTRPQVAPALPLNQPPRQQQNDGDATNQSAAKAEESNEKQPTTDAAAIEELAQKVSQLKTSAPAQNGKPAAQSGPRQQPASGSYGHRGGRGRGNYHGSTRKVEVPATDYDFEEANAKFNKQDLVKEAIAAVPGEATSPTAANGEQADGAVGEPPIPPAEPLYNPGKSFFDNISCENKERAEGGDSQNRRGWKSEEQRKNLETFGQGSVDSYGSRYYRGGWRGRGRGGYRGGRGGYNRGGYQNRSQAVNPQ